jgi:predicted TIM-barrel fold metal-dependent hydrolase
MNIDVHVHISACLPGHGSMSTKLRRGFLTRFLRLRFGVHGGDEETERGFEALLKKTIDETKDLDAAVVLAFDQVYDEKGNTDPARTHLYVTNDYIMELAARHPKMLFGCSVNPYRKDAVAELERCVKAGAVLVKWLPITQGFDPSHKLCYPLYEAMAHHKIALLCHTSGERALPVIAPQFDSPCLLKPAIERGVTVIAAHCGSKATSSQVGYVKEFCEMAMEHEHFYGDTSALNLAPRWHAYEHILKNEKVRNKLVHGSDWPIICYPSPKYVSAKKIPALMLDMNWMRRDLKIKQEMGFDEAYFHRAAKVLGLPKKKA